ncbi:MAG: Stp1/IreP family PP2C-type Ser/Thr phosphatase [Chroococcales cyanobacterium]
MKRCYKGLTDPGLVRAVNQDDYYTDDPNGRFFIVADGMGGHAGGQEASKIATQVICDYFEKHWDSATPSNDLLEQAVLQANQALLADQNDHPERADMGTTVVVLLFRENQYWYTHVGDSRFYLLRNGKLQQITEDHTWVARALRLGDITKEQSRIHPWRHVLSQCLGRKDLPKVEVHPLDVKPGDRLLLCSDGLSGEVSDESIASYLRSYSDCAEAAEVLVEAARDNGGADNITVIVVTIEEDS